MNKECMINADILIVSNEKGSLTERELTLKFYEVFRKENDIEIIRNELNTINNEIKNYHIKVEEYKKKCRQGLLAILGLMFGINILLYFLIPNLYVIENIKNIIFSTVFAGSYCSLFPLINFLNYNDYKRKLKLNEFQKRFLDKRLFQEQDNLQRLYMTSKSLTSNLKNAKVQIEDRKQLQNLRNYFEKLRIYGSKIEKIADKYARGFWTEEDKEKVQNDGINPDLFENYLIEYNTCKLMKGKKTS